MILCDKSIRERIKEILPNSDDLPRINPASIDLCLGAYILREPLGPDSVWTSESLRQRAYILKPREVLLVSTDEVVHIPPDLAGEIRLKSSRAREGFNMGNAGYVDPGWRGILTFQIQNTCNNRQNQIHWTEPFFQLVLHTLDQPSERSYEGKYQDAKSVEGAKE
jgi:deoxycytidine triphosphate deaminase